MKTPIDLPALRAVGFDLMDTLVLDPWVEAAEAATGLPHATIETERTRGVWHAFEVGAFDAAGYAERFFPEGSPHRLDMAIFKRVLDAGFAWLPGMERLAHDAAARWPVHVLSNYPDWYEAIAARFGFARFVTGHHVSYALGVRKPDAAFYDAALARIGVRPHELLFVDDREENVAAARALGIQALVFDGAEALRATLAL